VGLVAVALIARLAPAVGSASDGEHEDGTRLLLLRDEHDENLYVLKADGFVFGASFSLFYDSTRRLP
jgi:hypothetical protein